MQNPIPKRKHPIFSRYVADRLGNVFGLINNYGNPRSEPRPIRFGRDRRGYLRFTVIHEGRKISYRASKFVIECFKGLAPAPNMQCAHENGNKRDNRACNLKWKTPQQNSDDRDRHKTVPRGTHVYNAALTWDQVDYIRKHYRKFENATQLARELGVSYTVVIQVATGRTYKEQYRPKQ